MNILFTNEAPLIKYGLAQGFVQLGHNVKIIMGEEDRLWGHPAEEQVRRFYHAVADFRPDLIFMEGYAGIDVNGICSIINNMKIPLFYWDIESPVTPNLAEEHAPYADFMFTTTQEMVPVFNSKYGKPSEVLLFGVNPDFHKQALPNPKYACDLMLIATNYSNRYDKTDWFVKPLIDKGYNIQVWGLWWDDDKRPLNLKGNPIYKGVLPYEELNSAYCSSKIALGMNCDVLSETQHSMRIYEVLGAGGAVYLGHHSKSQEKLFGDIVFHAQHAEETQWYVNYILGMPDDIRREHVLRGQREVYSKHTYKIRAQQIMDIYNRFY